MIIIHFIGDQRAVAWTWPLDRHWTVRMWPWVQVEVYEGRWLCPLLKRLSSRDLPLGTGENHKNRQDSGSRALCFQNKTLECEVGHCDAWHIDVISGSQTRKSNAPKFKRDIASVLNMLWELIQPQMGCERCQNYKYGCRYQVDQSGINLRCKQRNITLHPNKQFYWNWIWEL